MEYAFGASEYHEEYQEYLPQDEHDGEVWIDFQELGESMAESDDVQMRRVGDNEEEYEDALDDVEVGEHEDEYADALAHSHYEDTDKHESTGAVTRKIIAVPGSSTSRGKNETCHIR